MNAKELSQRMAADAERIAQHLLPAGRKAGREWKAGDTNGDKGSSLSVCVKGERAGVWADFATGEGGDLLDLWMACRACSLADAIKDAKAFLGVRDDMPVNQPKKTYSRPAKPQAQKAKGRARQWLVDRGLTDETIEAFKIAEQVRGEQVFAVFPYLRDGEYVNAKYRDIDSKRSMRQEKDAEPCLFGWHLIAPRTRVLAITEGEIDAMTLHQMGIAAVSINNGAGSHDWIESDWTRLECFTEFLVAFDSDEPGEKGAREVMQRLGLERCKRLRFPGAKDANEYLLTGAERVDFHDAVEAARPMDPDELISANDRTEEVIEEFYPPEDRPKHPTLYVDKHLDWFRFHPGEYTAWTGWNGHGKSLFLDQVLLGLMRQRQRVVVFSGELTAVRHLKRVHKQASGLDRPSKEYIRAVGRWLGESMWIFDVVGNAKLARLLEVFTYAARRYGASHFVIDSLMMLDVPVDGPGALSAQKIAIQTIVAFARRHGAHVHLVAHPRKGRDESQPPSKMEVAGSLDIINAADNVFAVWRNKKDEAPPDPEDQLAMAKWHEQQQAPDGKLVMSKNRHGDFQDYVLQLWFDKASMQYRTQSRRYPFAYVEFPSLEDAHAHHDT
ncbi:toprim domain-containing protein [Pseudorhodoferax sp.]|uniref:toprim domain-containing protein n=1 Tax=Pseudorhodoferax sp. TaxID=1993553 RepID=UPI0039E3302C